MSDQITADLIAALKLLVDTGFPVTDEYCRSHWAISEAQRRIAREAIAKAEAAEELADEGEPGPPDDEGPLTAAETSDPAPPRSKYAGLFDELFTAWNGGKP